jgi:hypothetical protein
MASCLEFWPSRRRSGPDKRRVTRLELDLPTKSQRNQHPTFFPPPHQDNKYINPHFMTATNSDPTSKRPTQNFMSVSNQLTSSILQSPSKMDATPPMSQMDALTLSYPSPSNTTTESAHHPTTFTTTESTPPSNPNPATITISEIRSNKPLWYKLHVYIYDLRNFREVPFSQARLGSIVDASYIGLPYFTPEEVTLLKSTRIPLSNLSGNTN